MTRIVVLGAGLIGGVLARELASEGVASQMAARLFS